MSATAEHIAQLRRMIAEPGITIYTDVILKAMIERYPRTDAAGIAPGSAGWTPTYDLHAAAAEVWEEKAAAAVSNFDFSADGGDYKRSQQYDHCQKQARYHRTRASATSGRLVQYPKETSRYNFPWIINLREEDE